ncbi:MAG: hypothetical protein D6776_06710 [Planctomycetota bacterium]|nr:MAG: hypothetical protein D6776_06710 [Planctomycetota bacterium]
MAEHAVGAAAREPIDLGPALRDGYLQRFLCAPACDPVELRVHRMRCVLPYDAPPSWRVLAVRCSGVAALACAASEFDPDEQRFVPSERHWPARLESDRMLPPVVTSCTLDAGLEATELERLEREGLWLAGSPAALVTACAQGARLLELRASGAFEPEVPARLAVFIAARDCALLTAGGPITAQQALLHAAAWRLAWRNYRQLRHERPDLPPDPQFEWAREQDVLPDMTGDEQRLLGG